MRSGWLILAAPALFLAACGAEPLPIQSTAEVAHGTEPPLPASVQIAAPDATPLSQPNFDPLRAMNVGVVDSPRRASLPLRREVLEVYELLYEADGTLKWVRLDESRQDHSIFRHAREPVQPEPRVQPVPVPHPGYMPPYERVD